MIDAVADLAIAILVLIGSGLMLLAAIGIVRTPDVYVRLQTSTKASSLGAGCLLMALAVHFGDLPVAVRAMLAILFIFLTVPISAHMIARAAYLSGVPLWERTWWDDLRGRYHGTSHQPSSPEPEHVGLVPSVEEARVLLGMLRDGRTDAEIGARLGVPPRTVAAWLDEVLARRGAGSRADAVRGAGSEGGSEGSGPGGYARRDP